MKPLHFNQDAARNNQQEALSRDLVGVVNNSTCFALPPEGPNLGKKPGSSRLAVTAAGRVPAGRGTGDGTVCNSP